LIVVKFCWGITLLASLLAGLGLAISTVLLSSAPQQAAGAALSVGLAVIPYVLTRAVEGLKR